MIALAALVVVAAVLISLLLQGRGAGTRNPAEAPSSSTPTVSEWDEPTQSHVLRPLPTRPEPTMLTPTTTAADSPATDPTPKRTTADCLTGRLDYDGLSVCGIEGWSDFWVARSNQSHMPGQMTVWLNPIGGDSHVAQISLRDYPRSEDTPDAATAASVIMSMHAQGASQTVSSKAMTVSAHDGWRICATEDDALQGVNLTINVALIDPGDGKDWVYFLGIYPTSQPDLGTLEDAAMATLTFSG